MRSLEWDLNVDYSFVVRRSLLDFLLLTAWDWLVPLIWRSMSPVYKPIWSGSPILQAPMRLLCSPIYQSGKNTSGISDSIILNPINNAQQAKYGYVELTHRFGDASIGRCIICQTWVCWTSEKTSSSLTPLVMMRERISRSMGQARASVDYSKIAAAILFFFPLILYNAAGLRLDSVNALMWLSALTYHQYSEGAYAAHLLWLQGEESELLPGLWVLPKLTTMGMGTERIERRSLEFAFSLRQEWENGSGYYSKLNMATTT